jgi:CRISPR system Cascade subunit CasC
MDKLKEKCHQSDLFQGFGPELIDDVIDRIAGIGKHADKKDADKDKEKGLAVTPWSLYEIREMCSIVKEAKGNEKEVEKKMKEKAKNIMAAMGKARDIALSGRMATSGLMIPIDGAMALAHSITTHAVDADIDWFTAVDDLTQEEGESGAGHLNTQEFSSGVFYRYASLNIHQLATNIGTTRKEALEVAAHLTELLAMVVPSGKQRSFAAYNPADLVLVGFSDLPLSAANAFERPVEKDSKGGFLRPSIEALEDYITRVYEGFGLTDQKAVFSLWDTKISPKKKTLEDLKNWVRNDGV